MEENLHFAASQQEGQDLSGCSDFRMGWKMIRKKAGKRVENYQSIFKRVEKKYILSGDQYQAFMPAAGELLESDEYGESSVMNIYYDQPDFYLIRRSLEKPLYKEKLRVRCYGRPEEDSHAFVEIKKKYDGIVYKRRISLPYQNALNCLAPGQEKIGMADFFPDTNPANRSSRQIAEEIEYFRKRYAGLRPMMTVCYDRTALRGKKDPGLRITMDRNIHWRTEEMDLRKGSWGRAVLEPGQYLMEIKIAGAMPVELVKIMNNLQIFPRSFSKYGRAYMTYAREAREAERAEQIEKIYERVPEREKDKWQIMGLAGFAAGLSGRIKGKKEGLHLG